MSQTALDSSRNTTGDTLTGVTVELLATLWPLQPATSECDLGIQKRGPLLPDLELCAKRPGLVTAELAAETCNCTAAALRKDAFS